MRAKVHTFTRRGVRELDRAAVEDLGIPGIILMENAAASIERAVLGMLEGHGPGWHVEIYCGPGNNGGDGFALARRLFCRGVSVGVLAGAPRERYSDDALVNHDVARKMNLPMVDFDARRPSLGFEAMLESGEGTAGAMVVDALFGTGLDRAIGSPYDEVVNWMNMRRRSGCRVLAVDIPSGLDCDTGEPLGGSVVTADRTITLAGMKFGFSAPGARRFTGDVEVGEIGVPESLLKRFAAV